MRKDTHPKNESRSSLLIFSDISTENSDLQWPKTPRDSLVTRVGILTVDKLLQKKANDSISSNVSGSWIDNLASKKALLPMTVMVDGMSKFERVTFEEGIIFDCL